MSCIFQDAGCILSAANLLEEKTGADLQRAWLGWKNQLWGMWAWILAVDDNMKKTGRSCLVDVTIAVLGVIKVFVLGLLGT